MSVEAYITTSVEFDGEAVESPFLITLHDPDGPAPSGCLTAPTAITAGRAGRLKFEGSRDGKLWSLVCPQITVTHTSAVGCEFSVAAPPTRTQLADPASAD